MSISQYLTQLDKVFLNSFFRTDFRLEAQKLQRKGMNGLYCFMATSPIILGIIIVEKIVGHELILLELTPIILAIVSWTYLYYIGAKLSKI